VTRIEPTLTHSGYRWDGPSWRMPFPSLPTIGGRRPASRRERKRWKKEQRMWRGPSAAWTMREYARINALSPDEAATDGW